MQQQPGWNMPAHHVYDIRTQSHDVCVVSVDWQLWSGFKQEFDILGLRVSLEHLTTEEKRKRLVWLIN